MWINKIKEPLFWTPIICLFAPILFLIRSNQEISKNILIPLTNDWKVSDGLKNTPIFLKNNTGSTVQLVNQLNNDLKEIANPYLYLGQVGDYDEVFFNGCHIGSLGRIENNRLVNWWWGALRFYKVPSECVQKENEVRINITTFSTMPQGMLTSQIGISSYSKLSKYIQLTDFLRFKILLGFALLIFSIGIYFLYVFTLVPERHQNGVFSLLCFSVAVFEIMVSTIPYRYFTNQTTLMFVNFTSAIIASTTFLFFINIIFDLKRQKVIFGYMTIALGFIVSCFIHFQFPNISVIYRNWYPILLITFLYFYFYLLKQTPLHELKMKWRYIVGITVLLVTIIIDVIISVTGFSTLYLVPYGFVFLLTASAFALAKESADAFLFVEEQVSERTRELSVAIEQAKGAEKMKEKFFAQISHDLKTPIAIAIGAIEESISKYSDSVGKILEPANRHLIRLNQMVLSILDNVKAESGTLKLQWQKVKVAQYLIGILEPFQGVAKKAGVNLDFNFSGYEGLSIPMDPEKMERVIENLITNSIKYTKTTDKSEKVVEVSIKVDQSKVYIGIEDSGLGIPKGEREKIFDKFFQSSITDLKIHGGSGIGLSFVKDMIELHNGSVYADESKYGGAKFTIELPLAQDIDNLQSYHFASTNPKILAGSLNVDYPKTNPDQIDPYKISILYCEDNPEMAQIGYSTLKDQYNVFFAENGHEGLKILDTNKIDLILSDIQMPQMDGYDLLKEVRKQPKFEKIPLIFLSSLGAEDDIVKGLNMGANDYLNKPMRKEMLHTRIKAQLKNSELLRKVVSSEKMSSLGLLMAGLAHELKNPIHALTGNIGYIDTKMLPKLSDPNQKPEVLDKMLENLKLITDAAKNSLSSMQRIVSSVNEFSSENKNKQKLDLNQVIQNSITMLQYKIKEVSHCEVVFKPSEEHEIYSYSSIEQVFVNLIQNAIDAVEDKKNGVIEINIQSSSDHKMIKIKDNGSGIDPKIIDHIFDAFMTTKEVKKGTGLGLYITKQIVENQLGGTITVISELGKGTTFTVDIPSESPDLTLVAKPFHGVENLI